MRYIKKKLAVILTGCLVLGIFPCAVALARGHVEVDRKCSITVKVPDTWKDLDKADFNVELYRVADIDKYGTYTANDTFKELNDSLSKVDDKTTAEDWAAMGQMATEVVKAGNVEKAYNIEMKNGAGVCTDVETGLYLVYTEDVTTTGYGYSFTPYLLSAPNAKNASEDSAAGDWMYDDIVIGLKAEQYVLKGNLEILKSLKTYNSSLGTPLFVFDVEAYDEEGNVVFSDIVSISFDAAGKRKAVVKDIPAGSRVVVTEVYSGSSYETVSASEQSATIIADEFVTVDFDNDYTEHLVYGTGVVNHFEYDGTGWEWHQIKDNQ